MRCTTTSSTLLALGLLGALWGCGGSEQVTSRTVAVEGKQFELVAHFPTDVSPARAHELLGAVTIHRWDRHAEPPTRIIDPFPEIHIEIVPHDDEEDEAAPVYFAMAASSFAKEESAAEEEESDPSPIAPARDPSLDRYSTKGATDPDVDPAMPQ